jgi:predicted membrane protein
MTELKETELKESEEEMEMTHSNQGSHNHHQLSGMIFGGIVVLAGIVLLLDRAGVLAPYEFWDFWPMSLVIFGLVNLAVPAAAPHRVFGGLLLVAGATLQMHKLDVLPFEIGMVWPVFVIALGIHIFWSTWYRRKQDGNADVDSPDRVDELVIFGGSNSASRSKAFSGGEATAIFGGCDLDLTRAQIEGDAAVLWCRAVFGGVDVRVPEDWEVVVKGVGILGGYEDKTRHPSNGTEQKPKQLIIKGYAIFGGVDIKN